MFGEEDEETDEKAKGQNKEDKDSEDDSGDETGGFFAKWGMIYFVKNVSDMTKLDWPTVFNMNIYEFLNILCFNIDFHTFQESQIKQLQRRR